MIKAILFDVDGVILNTKLFSERFSKEYGVSIDKLLPFFKGPLRECQIGRADLLVELEKVKDDWGFPGTAQELADYWFADIKTSLNTELLEEVTQLRSKGILCYIATNQESNRAKYLWEDAELSNYFDGIFASCALGVKKPETKFFDLVTAHLELKPVEISFFDSDQEIVDAAIEYGMPAYLYTNQAEFKTDLAKLDI